MHQEPDMGFDPGSPGSRPGPKAGAKPLRHPGIPSKIFKYFFNFYLFMKDTEREREAETGRGRSRLHAGSLMWDLIPGPRDHDLRSRQTLNH